jgi:hypothetical protein
MVLRTRRITVLIASVAVIVVLSGCQPLMLGWLFSRPGPDLDGPDTATDEGLLESLEVSAGILVPEFESRLWEYEVTVPDNTASLTVTGVPRDLAAMVSENSGVPQQLDGEATIIVISVELNGYREEYTVRVSR